MSQQLEAQAWHVAGHAYAAIGFQFPVFRLSLDEFPDSIFEEARGKQWIDERTIVEPREIRLPPGTSEHTRMMDNLTAVALCGPAAELQYRGEPCSIERVQQFPFDWQLATESHSYVWSDGDFGQHMLERQIERAAVYVSHANTVEMIEAFASYLLEHRSMSGEESQTLWDEVTARQEARANRPINRRLFDLYADDVDEEWMDLSVDPDEELEAFDIDEEPYPE